MREQVDGVEFAISERDRSLLASGGPIRVRYADRGYFRGYRASVASGGTC